MRRFLHIVAILPHSSLRGLGYLVTVAAALGCGPSDSGSRGADASAHADGASSAISSAISSASASASEISIPADPMMGTWDGKFEAKRFKPTLDPGVSDAEWAADDGKAAVGPGSMTLSVDASGRVSGSFEGALGQGTVSGATSPEGLRASLVAADPSAEGAMGGTVVVVTSGAELVGELRAASADARVVRVATVRLARQ
jgi:hypothetical protein